jgi:hypothetical protein
MSKWARPLNMEILTVTNAVLPIDKDLDLQDILSLYRLEFFQQPSTPHIELPNLSNLDTWAALGKAPYCQVPTAPRRYRAFDPGPGKATALRRPLRAPSAAVTAVSERHHRHEEPPE